MRLRHTGLALALVSIATPALAQNTCAMLPSGRPPEGPVAPRPAQEQANAAVMTALTSDGLTVIPAEDAQRRMMGEPFSECNELHCGSSVVHSLGVEFVVLVTVWAPRGTPTVVVVTLIGDGDSAAGDSPVEGGNVQEAARRALVIARQRWNASRMGFLNVTTEPPGAEVEVDGTAIGHTPIRHLILSGERRVRLRLDGYDPVDETVRIVAQQEQPLEVTLQRSVTIANPPPLTTRTEASWVNWLIGIGLIAGGGVAAISPINTLVNLGSCADMGTLGCRSEVTFGPQSWILTLVSAAVITTGVIWLIAQPITTTVTVGPSSAMLTLEGTWQ